MPEQKKLLFWKELQRNFRFAVFMIFANPFVFCFTKVKKGPSGSFFDHYGMTVTANLTKPVDTEMSYQKSRETVKKIVNKLLYVFTYSTTENIQKSS